MKNKEQAPKQGTNKNTAPGKAKVTKKTQPKTAGKAPVAKTKKPATAAKKTPKK